MNTRGNAAGTSIKKYTELLESGKINVSELSRQCKIRLRELQAKLNQISQEDVLSGNILEEAKSQIVEIYEHRQDAERRASQFALERDELEHKIKDLNVSHKSNIHTLVEELAQLKQIVARYERLGDIESIEFEKSKRQEDLEKRLDKDTERIAELENELQKNSYALEGQQEFGIQISHQLDEALEQIRNSDERTDRLEKQLEEKIREAEARNVVIQQQKADLDSYKKFGSVNDLERKIFDQQNLEEQRTRRDAQKISELETLVKQKNREIGEKQEFHAHVNIQLEDIEKRVQESNEKVIRLTQELENKTSEANELQNTLARQKTDLANLDKDMQYELATKDEQIDQLKKDLVKLDEVCTAHALEIENLRTGLSQQVDEVASLDRANTELESALSEKEDEINRLQLQLDSIDKADSELQSVLSRKDEDFSKLQHQFDDLKEAHSKSQTTLSEKDYQLSDLQHRLTDLAKVNLELQSTMSKKDDQLSRLQHQLVDTRNDIQKLRQEEAVGTLRNKTKDDRIEYLERNLADATTQIQDLEHLLEQRNTDLSNVERSLELTTERLENTKTRSNATADKITQLERTLSDKMGENIELQTSLSKLQKRVEELTTCTRENDKEIKRVMDSLSKKDLEIFEQKKSLTTKLNTVLRQLQEKAKEVEQLEATVEKQAERIDTLEEGHMEVEHLEQALNESNKMEMTLEWEKECLFKEIKELEDKIKDLDEIISQKTSENDKLTTLFSQNAERERQIVAQIQDNDKELEKMRGALAHKNAEIAESKRAHSDTAMRLESANRQAKQTQARIVTLEGEVEDITRAYALVEERSARISQLEHTVEMIQADLAKAIEQRRDVEEQHSVLQIKLDQSQRKFEKLETAFATEQQSNKENATHMERLRKKLEDEKMDLQVDLRRAENHLEKERIEIRRLKDALQILSEYTQQALAEQQS
ncbi:hypothetical protein DFQ28_007662 [Apophysomyces sp. BC1034]|nr:hypothetical protein DFQ28_007662 [Apophysomyces sp. BC1034]